MHQPHILVKHTQTIRRQQLTNCFSVFDQFGGLERKGLIKKKKKKRQKISQKGRSVLPGYKKVI